MTNGNPMQGNELLILVSVDVHRVITADLSFHSERQANCGSELRVFSLVATLGLL